ncbi:hypothetical protein CCP2SC5_1280007 [Azospirillaceae bacterium]
MATVGVTATWRTTFDDCFDSGGDFTLVVANEFFDALPVRQFHRTPTGWAEKRVDLDPEGSGLRFVSAPMGKAGEILLPPSIRDQARPGVSFELCPLGLNLARAIGDRLALCGGAALIIDYGYDLSAVDLASMSIDTVQAVRKHGFAPVLESPGEADLTAHVDFMALAAAAAEGEAWVWGPVEQGVFLRALGIEVRAAQLQRSVPKQADMIAKALRRLIDDSEETTMGRLFKALVITGREIPAPAGVG